TVMQWTRNRSFTNRDAVLNLWYSVGLVIELLIASKLLPMGAPAVWLAYLLIGSSALCVAAGFVWYLLWALERGFALSYLAAICLTFVPAAAASIHILFGSVLAEWQVICVAVLVHVGAAYFTYRILKVLLSRCYKMLL